MFFFHFISFYSRALIVFIARKLDTVDYPYKHISKNGFKLSKRPLSMYMSLIFISKGRENQMCCAVALRFFFFFFFVEIYKLHVFVQIAVLLQICVIVMCEAQRTLNIQHLAFIGTNNFASCLLARLSSTKYFFGFS